MYSAKRLIHELRSSAWLIAPSAAEQFIPLHVRLITGEPVSGVRAWDDDGDREEKDTCPVMVCTVNGTVVARGKNAINAAPQESIAVIPIEGPIMKNDSCGDAGTMTMAQWVKDAAANPNIGAIVLKVDSPGGTVSGTQTLSNAIQEAKLQKPVISFIEEGMMASAAYWIGSNSDEIFASQSTDEIGSIGVYTSMADFTKRYEDMGIKVKDFYAPQSSQKNEDYRHFQETGEGSGHLVDGLAAIADRFITVVKTNRGEKLNLKAGDPFKGRLYNAEEALSIGLIDQIGSFSSALLRASELSAERKGAATSATQTNTNNTMKFNLTWKGIGQILGITTERVLTNEDWEAADKKVSELLSTISSLEEAATAAQEKITALEGQVKTLTTERDNLQATVDTYGKKPGADHTNPNKTVEVIESSETQKMIDDLPHNKTADALGL